MVLKNNTPPPQKKKANKKQKQKNNLPSAFSSGSEFILPIHKLAQYHNAEYN
jgi:hypothetical protein